MKKISEIISKSAKIPVLVFKRLADGKENIDALKTELGINDDDASVIFSVCTKDVEIYSDSDVSDRITDNDDAKKYKKNKKELYGLGMQEHKTIKQLKKDLTEPGDNDFLNSVNVNAAQPMNTPVRETEYVVLQACAAIANKEYKDITCAMFITTANTDTGKDDYTVAVAYNSEGAQEIFKRVNIK